MAILSRDQERTTHAGLLAERPPLSSRGPATPATQAPLQDHFSVPSMHPLETPLPPRSGSISIVPGFRVSFNEADKALQEYAADMVPQFPFVPLPCHNAYDMYKDKPLLLKTILWVCRPPGPEESAAYEDWFRQLYGLLSKRYKLEYTPHYDHCCWKLTQDQEYLTDSLLVHLIRIQQIANKVNDAFWEMIEDANDRPCWNLHSITIASIRKELDKFLQELPDHLKENHLLQTHCAAIRIRLFEPIRYGNKSAMLEPTQLRCRTMWDCLESTQGLHNAFRMVPVECYPSLTFIPVLQLALAIIKASRLLLVADPAWDLDTARTLYDFPENLRRLSKCFEAASSLARPRCGILVHGRPVFSQYAEAYRDIESRYLYSLHPVVDPSDSTFKEPVTAQSGEQHEGLDFWNLMSDLPYGLTPCVPSQDGL
ncbi:hypothetical protein SEUCBS140593_007025 [Sporothrix eucalyptigena]|uniref:Uncharacterized protein n=1 Tax=Sporothrix eucalyptigena TaxID=1812306 RepID=A0ABP0C9R2_9PEZI